MQTRRAWGQNLLLHPHIHCVIPAGGLSPDQLVAALVLCTAIVVFGLYLQQRKSERVLRFFVFPEENTTPLLTQDNAGPVVLAPDGSALSSAAAARAVT